MVMAIVLEICRKQLQRLAHRCSLVRALVQVQAALSLRGSHGTLLRLPFLLRLRHAFQHNTPAVCLLTQAERRCRACTLSREAEAPLHPGDHLLACGAPPTVTALFVR